ncbi:MAG: DUF2238 domain-containing protein [Clostridiales bacterium]|nr:DUF2238 domain-containing protein [Clostridiales bacterium]
MDGIGIDGSNKKTKHKVLLLLSVLMIVWSSVNAIDYFAWFMLTLPSVILLLCLSLTYKKFQFTTFTYIIIFLHIVVLASGAKYRYAGNPLFLNLKEIFDLNRNYYDRIGHFMQGFAPMFMVKEFMLRRGYMKRSKFFYLIIIGFVLSISATWELSEFFAAMITGKPSSYILSSQGVLWDTQWDMILAIIGAVSALVIFGNFHDRQIEAMKEIDK